MGSCVSVHKDPKSSMKLRVVFASKNDKLVNPSPINSDVNKITDDDDGLQVKSQVPHVPVTSLSNYGSKDENFFDTQVWLESDCDDDFFSVKGDFTPSVGNTPSRGNTPVHRGFFAGNKSPSVERPPVPLPQSLSSNKRKKLFELFKDSVRNQNANVNEQVAEENQNVTSIDKEALLTGQQLPPKSTPSSLTTPVTSGEQNPSEEFKAEPGTPKSGQCCLPMLRSSGSFGEKRKSISPAHSVA